MKSLSEKKIVLCVTGSVAAIESPKIARELRRRGAKVFVVMTKSATHIVSPDVMRWASNNPVATFLDGRAQHVSLAGLNPEKADLILIAPSTANTIGKIAAGIDDTSVTTLVSTGFGSGIPIIVMPAMHASMYFHPIVKENIEKLKMKGVHFIEPKKEENKAKILDAKTIADTAEMILSEQDFKGKKILVTAGATIEEIDEVRFISNKSSGKMGKALAEQCFRRGAEATLLTSKKFDLNPKIKQINFTSTEDLEKEIKKHKNLDAVFHSAAVSDFKIKKFKGKIKSGKKIKLELIPNKKILPQLRNLFPKALIVGFKAEVYKSKKELEEIARKKLKECKLDFIVANDVSKNVFGSDSNEVLIVSEKNSKHLKRALKEKIANQILDEIKAQKFGRLFQ